MGYKIQPVQTNFAKDNIALGIELKFDSPGVFTSLYSTEHQSINNLKNLLLTRVGERYEKPTYGTNLLTVIFQPNVNELKSDIDEIITYAVSKWLPEVNIQRIDITTAEEDPTLDHAVKINLSCTVNTDKFYNVVISATESGQLTIE